jgi:hypothetical protein
MNDNLYKMQRKLFIRKISEFNNQYPEESLTEKIVITVLLIIFLIVMLFM